MIDPLPDFGPRERILATIDSIPSGRVASYGHVALAAGLPGRARFVGRVLRELGSDHRLPWWRVLRADGSLAELGGGARQRGRLEAEGVRFDQRGRVRMGDHRWHPDAAGDGALAPQHVEHPRISDLD